MSESKASKDILKEIGITTKKIWTVIFLLSIGLLIFLLYGSTCIVESKYTFEFGKQSVEQTVHHIDWQFILQWIILILLVAILWMWRGKFGIEGFGPVMGKPTQSEEPPITTNIEDRKINDMEKEVDFKKSFEAKCPQQNNSTCTIPSQPQKIEDGAKRRSNKSIKTERMLHLYGPQLQKLFQDYRVLSITRIAKELHISTKNAYNLLKANPTLFEIYGKGEKGAASSSNSLENKVLDTLSASINTNGLLEEIRNAQINDRVIDAVFRSPKEIYFIEIKRFIQNTSLNSFSKTISVLYQTLKKFNTPKKTIVLGICTEEKQKQVLTAWKNQIQRRNPHVANLQVKFFDNEGKEILLD